MGIKKFLSRFRRKNVVPASSSYSPSSYVDTGLSPAEEQDTIVLRQGLFMLADALADSGPVETRTFHEAGLVNSEPRHNVEPAPVVHVPVPESSPAPIQHSTPYPHHVDHSSHYSPPETHHHHDHSSHDSGSSYDGGGYDGGGDTGSGGGSCGSD